MAELENNLETVEETVETVAEEGQQPDSKAEKGDKNLLNKVHPTRKSNRKGEVVKPEENPVDKSVASVKSAKTKLNKLKRQ